MNALAAPWTQRSAGLDEAAAEDRLPALAGQVEIAGLGVVGDAVEDVIGIVDLRQLFGIHLAPEVAEIGDGVEAARRRIEPHDHASGKEIAVKLAVHELQLVEAENVARAGRADLHRLADREGRRVRIVERGAAVAEDQIGAVVGQAQPSPGVFILRLNEPAGSETKDSFSRQGSRKTSILR